MVFLSLSVHKHFHPDLDLRAKLVPIKLKKDVCLQVPDTLVNFSYDKSAPWKIVRVNMKSAMKTPVESAKKNKKALRTIIFLYH